MTRPLPEPSDAEWRVLHALWLKQPASARELLDELADVGWAYTTLKTMLTRMEAKGLVAYDVMTERYEVTISALRVRLEQLDLLFVREDKTLFESKDHAIGQGHLFG